MALTNLLYSVAILEIASLPVAKSGGGGGWSYGPLIGLKSMQNKLFLALFRPIFALKTKIALLGIGDENRSVTCYDLSRENWVAPRLKTFFILLLEIT